MRSAATPILIGILIFFPSAPLTAWPAAVAASPFTPSPRLFELGIRFGRPNPEVFDMTADLVLEPAGWDEELRPIYYTGIPAAEVLLLLGLIGAAGIARRRPGRVS